MSYQFNQTWAWISQRQCTFLLMRTDAPVRPPPQHTRGCCFVKKQLRNVTNKKRSQRPLSIAFKPMVLTFCHFEASLWRVPSKSGQRLLTRRPWRRRYGDEHTVEIMNRKAPLPLPRLNVSPGIPPVLCDNRISFLIWSAVAVLCERVPVKRGPRCLFQLCVGDF